jgi:hypothetical protein
MGLGSLLEPIEQLFASELTGCQRKNDGLLLVDRCNDVLSVEDEEDLHDSMTDTLVPIDKGVSLHQCEAKRGGLLQEGRVEVGSAERCARLCEG